MLVFDNDNKPLILDSIHTPTIADHIWVLDLQMKDFTLTPLMVLEEIYAPTVELLVCGFQFPMPSPWNILVVDPETMQLDITAIKDVAGKEFHVFLYGLEKSRHETAVARVVDYHPYYYNVAPSLNKHQMLCHPVAPDVWVNVAPSDTYNKYLKEAIAGDLI